MEKDYIHIPMKITMMGSGTKMTQKEREYLSLVEYTSQEHLARGKNMAWGRKLTKMETQPRASGKTTS